MCETNELLICPKHANQAVKKTYKYRLKCENIFLTNPNNKNLFKKLRAIDSHEHALDIYYSTDYMLAQLSKNSENYQKYYELNKILKIESTQIDK